MIPCLTICEPYASLIANGEKWVENRIWHTHVRGRIAIHAGKSKAWLEEGDKTAYPFGCVVATANLVGCVSLDRLKLLPRDTRLKGCSHTVGELLAHPHTNGPFCFLLEDVRRLTVPVPHTGKQGWGAWDPHPAKGGGA